MELWIRSQSRQTLMKVSKIWHEQNDIFACVDTEFSERVGIYKSEARALEVLNEIQNILRPKGILKFNVMLNNRDKMKIKEETNNEYMIIDRNVEVAQQPTTHVYQMPDE